MNDQKFPVPTIHGNGTSRDQLLEQVQEAHYAVCKAIDAMSLCAPNGRDYYPQGDAALKWATKFHVERVAKLVSVRDELMRLAEAIADTP